MPRKPFSAGPQPELIPPEVVELHLVVGIVGASGHAQIMFSVKNPGDGQLLQLESVPHIALESLQERLEDWYGRMTHEAVHYSNPF